MVGGTYLDLRRRDISLKNEHTANFNQYSLLTIAIVIVVLSSLPSESECVYMHVVRVHVV